MENTFSSLKYFLVEGFSQRVSISRFRSGFWTALVSLLSSDNLVFIVQDRKQPLGVLITCAEDRTLMFTCYRALVFVCWIEVQYSSFYYITHCPVLLGLEYFFVCFETAYVKFLCNFLSWYIKYKMCPFAISFNAFYLSPLLSVTFMCSGLGLYINFSICLDYFLKICLCSSLSSHSDIPQSQLTCAIERLWLSAPLPNLGFLHSTKHCYYSLLKFYILYLVLFIW